MFILTGYHNQALKSERITVFKKFEKVIEKNLRSMTLSKISKKNLGEEITQENFSRDYLIYLKYSHQFHQLIWHEICWCTYWSITASC